MSLDICEYLNWDALAWTLNADQMPADEDNCRKADLCVYLGERKETLAVEKYFRMWLAEYD